MSRQHVVHGPAERGIVKFEDTHVLRALVLHDEKTNGARLDGGERDFLEDADLPVGGGGFLPPRHSQVGGQLGTSR
jgi:hypothetical protein